MIGVRLVMSDEVYIALFFGAGVLFLVIFLFVLWAKSVLAKRRAAWIAAAEILGLHFKENVRWLRGSFCSLEGIYDEYSVSIQMVLEGSGEDARGYTVFSISFPHTLSKRIEAVGLACFVMDGQESGSVQEQDDINDVLAAIRGDETMFPSLFTAQRRSKIIDFGEMMGDLTIDTTSLSFKAKNYCEKTDVILEMMERMMDLLSELVCKDLE